MNDQAKTDGRMSLAIAGGIGIVGVLVGTAVTSLLILPALQIVHKGPVPTTRAPVQWKAVINRDTSDNSCTQYAAGNFGNGVKYAFPVLSKGGDSIVWHGRVNGAPGNKKVHVEFPQGGGSPFTDYKFDEDQPSGKVRNDADYGDYSFAMGNVKVDDVPCSSFKDPGVHVDQ